MRSAPTRLRARRLLLLLLLCAAAFCLWWKRRAEEHVRLMAESSEPWAPPPANSEPPVDEELSLGIAEPLAVPAAVVSSEERLELSTNEPATAPCEVVVISSTARPVGSSSVLRRHPSLGPTSELSLLPDRRFVSPMQLTTLPNSTWEPPPGR